MSLLVRAAKSTRINPVFTSNSTHLSVFTLHPSVGAFRTYAKKVSKSKNGKDSKKSQPTPSQDDIFAPSTSKLSPISTSSLVPGSKQKLTSESAMAEYAKAEEKMTHAVEWFRKECAAIETRASGRVTPSVLAPVRVFLPGNPETGLKLEEVATVGVRDGSMLLITLFEEDNIKFVETALYSAKIPGIVPQRQDHRTIKIPIPKPTVDARAALYTTAHRQAEDTRIQIRKQHAASVKRGKWEKRSIELEEFQKLTDRFIAEIDKSLAQLKKATGAK